MAVLISTHVENQTEALYDGMLALLEARLRQEPGFVMHSAHRADTGEWRVLEIWENKSQADQFFARQVAPHLPAGVRPKRSVSTLHSLVTATAS